MTNEKKNDGNYEKIYGDTADLGDDKRRVAGADLAVAGAAQARPAAGGRRGFCGLDGRGLDGDRHLARIGIIEPLDHRHVGHLGG